jgi:hypothetical protein
VVEVELHLHPEWAVEDLVPPAVAAIRLCQTWVVWDRTRVASVTKDQLASVEQVRMLVALHQRALVERDGK